MENTWQYQGTSPIKIKRYLNSLGMGHRLFNDIKHGAGEFQVDRRRVRPTTQILPHQTLTIKVHPEPADPTVLISHEPVTIIYDDANWLVVNKPSGMASIPGPHEQNNTVLNRVKGYLVDHRDDNQRPHLITRLDKYTSGLLLVAKHHVASSMISQQVEHHTMKKRYLALVDGQMPDDHGIIDAPIKRVPGQPQRIIAADGQNAKTEYWTLQSNAAHSLVKLELHSGRTHQIRLHLSSLGHPLTGDHLYGGDLSVVKHQQLQAFQLAFQDPFTEQPLSFVLPMDSQLQTLAKDFGLVSSQID